MPADNLTEKLRQAGKSTDGVEIDPIEAEQAGAFEDPTAEEGGEDGEEE